MRTFWLLIVAVCVSWPQTASAQRAQLGRKGRVPEQGQPAAGKPIRKLPRRSEINPLTPLPRTPLDQELERMRAQMPPPRPLPPDRIRELMRSTAEGPPLPPPAPLQIADLHPLPRLQVEPGSVSGRLPQFTMPPPDTAAESEREVPNRWELAALRPDGGEFPEWRRYKDETIDLVHHRGHLLDPYNRHRLKGDYPIIGRKIFLDITASSNTLMELRRVPVSSPASSSDSNTYDFFGRGEAMAIRQSFRPSFSLFKGSAGFKPVDWEVRITPEININYLLARENAITRIDVRERFRRTDSNVGFQEAYFEKRLFTNSLETFQSGKPPDHLGSARYDFTSLRLGIQRFTSDFRGFVFSDEQPGARLFGNFKNNIFQYNLAFFKMLEKDTNSGLNRWRDRHQNVYAANLYWFDFLTPGYNLNFSALYNNDQPSFLVDKNGFLVRPAPIGTPLPHKVRAGYVGISGDGHIKRYNISHSFYQALGRDDFNPIAGRAQHINAQMAAPEVAYEADWKIWKASVFFASGDGRIEDGEARGFDAIVPNQQFAGGGFLGNPALADRGLINNAFEGGGINFINRQAFPLTGTSVFLFGPNSLLPSLRPGPFQGQANFVNPGIFVFNVGMDAKITPKLRSTVNINYLRFHRTAVLEGILFQSGIRHSIGIDGGVGLQYRPKLNENIVITGGFGWLFPQPGFKNIYTVQQLYSGFILARFLF